MDNFLQDRENHKYQEGCQIEMQSGYFCNINHTFLHSTNFVCVSIDEDRLFMSALFQLIMKLPLTITLEVTKKD